MKGELLSIKKLGVRVRDGGTPILKDISLAMRPGSILAVVGGSGSGKTTLGMSVLGLLPPALERVSGEIMFEGTDVACLPPQQMRAICGRRIGMVFQEPISAFDPVYTIGFQIAETLAAHHVLGSAQIPSRILELLALAGVSDPERVSSSYSHELSGGLRQRAMIAQAIACGPSLVIADEPTSSLDVTVQARILQLFARLRKELGLAVVFITHDLGIARYLADEVVVMCCGEVVERGPVASVLSAPRQSYTRELIAAEGR
jgi:ABC-type glutathione transport system ATPase component